MTAGSILWARKFVFKTLYFTDDHIKRHKGLFVSTAGQNWDHVFDGAFPAITAIFNGTGFEYYDNIIANNMDEYKGIKNHPTALKDAFEKGQKVVAVLEKLTCAGIRIIPGTAKKSDEIKGRHKGPECCQDQDEEDRDIPGEDLVAVKDADGQHVERGDHGIDLDTGKADLCQDIPVQRS